jgi:hypothetical protein
MSVVSSACAATWEWNVPEQNVPLLSVVLPDAVAAVIVGGSVALALAVLLATVWPTLRREARPRVDVDVDVDVDAHDTAEASARPGLDIVLLLSTLAIVGLAVAVFLTRP